MAFEFYETDDTTSLSTHTFSSTAVLEAHLWWSKDTPGAGPADPCYLQVSVGGALSGHAALDAQEFQARIVGSSNPSADPAFAPALTGWTRLGTGAVLALPSFRGDCAVHLEVRVVLGISGGSQPPFTYELTAMHGTVPAALLPALYGDGIITGLGDGLVSEWVDWPQVTETGTPDEYANLPVRRALLLGIPYAWDAEAVELNQDDGDSASLSSGEAYWAILSQGVSSVTTTKGSKDVEADAVLPAAPAGELVLAHVLVQYDASASVIEQADIVQIAVAGRWQVRAGTGLEAIVGAGRAFVGRQYLATTAEQSVILDANATTTIYLDTSGLVTTGQAGYALPLAEVTTDGSAVTAIVDLRADWWEPRAQTLTLVKTGTESAATDVAQCLVPFRCAVDRATTSVRTASAGATGSTDLDINKSDGGVAASLFTGDVNNPSVAAQAYTDRTYPLVTLLDEGDWLSLDIDAATSGGSQAVDVAVGLTVVPRP